jgi:hypothetical protein
VGKTKPRAVRPETYLMEDPTWFRAVHRGLQYVSISTPSGWSRRGRAFGGRRRHSYDSALAETIKRSLPGRDYPSARAMASLEVVEFATLAWRPDSAQMASDEPGLVHHEQNRRGRPPTVDRPTSISIYRNQQPILRRLKSGGTLARAENVQHGEEKQKSHAPSLPPAARL